MEGSNASEPLLLQDQLESYMLGYVKSASLKCAVELGIPDAIYRHGGQPVSLAELHADLALPASKRPALRRLMRMLSEGGFFKFVNLASGDGGEEPRYTLTNLSLLLVNDGDRGPCFSSFVPLGVNKLTVESLLSLGRWFRTDDPDKPTAFEMTHGIDFWGMACRDTDFNTMFNTATSCDSKFKMDILLKEHGYQVFRGLTSLVDVGGGNGGATKAIAAMFPKIKCTVLDLPHVIAVAEKDGANIEFVAGDMFKYIPPVDAVFLKAVLHLWSDEDCIKILQKCKQAIPSKEDGGRVILVEPVIGSCPAANELLFSIDIVMLVNQRGYERTECEWREIFMAAGFSDYKILQVLRWRSIIEVYP